MPKPSPKADLDLSIVIPAKNEGPNLDLLLPQLKSALGDLGIRWEILVVDAASDDGTPDIVASMGRAIWRNGARAMATPF